MSNPKMLVLLQGCKSYRYATLEILFMWLGLNKPRNQTNLKKYFQPLVF